MGVAIQEFRSVTQTLGLRTDTPRRATRQRSNSAEWHGRVYWNLRNDFLDAVPHQVRQTGGDQSILRRNQFGFNVSGPVVIPWIYHGGNRTFFSFSYEGMRETSGQQFLETIATVRERDGDFSQVVDNSGQFLPIYDPATTRPNPNYDPSQPVSLENLQYLRDPFPGNTIDLGRLDAAAVNALQYYPRPNVAIGPYFRNNYSIYSPAGNEADGILAELDQTIGARHRLAFELNYSDGFASPAKVINTIANPRNPDSNSHSRSGEIDYNFTISPSTVNSARFQASTSTNENDAGLDNTGQTFPVLGFGSYLQMGASSPVSRSVRTSYRLSNGLTTRRGNHSLTFNASWNLSMTNSFLPRYPTGRFRFSRGLTSLPGIVNTGHAFASFLLGMAEYAEQSLVEQPSYFRERQAGFDFEDEWQASQNFTLTIGVSIDVQVPRVEKYDRQSTVDLNAINPANGLPGAVVFAGRNGYSRSFQPTQVLPSGSVGFAWDPFGDSKTVIRASMRRSRGAYGRGGSGHWGTQGFIGTPTFISENSQLVPAVIFEDGLPPPEHPLPDLRPDVANDTNADLLDMTATTPVDHRVTLSFERRLPGFLTVTVGGEYDWGRNQFASGNGVKLNAVQLSALQYRDQLYDDSFFRSLTPFPQYLDFDTQGWPVGKSSRTGVSVRVDKRTSQGLSLGFSYRYSRQYDDYSSSDGLQDYYHRENEWALSRGSPHSISLTYMYELPFGPDKRFLSYTDWRSHLFAGWFISGTTRYSTGGPIQLRADFNNTGGVVEALYVNAVPGEDPHLPNPSPELWFNPNAFVNPPDFETGNAARTHPTLRNPSSQNHDLAITKRFALYSGHSLEFVGTALNFLNHADWNQPDADIGTLESPNTNAGRITGSRGGRVMQLGLRYSF